MLNVVRRASKIVPMRIPLGAAVFSVTLFCGPCIRAQTEPPKTSSTLTVNSTLVEVPTLVSSPEGALLHSLSADDFKLLDNGVQQHVSLEDSKESEREPVAVVVLLQTGGAGSRQFASYAKLPTMLDYIAGNSAHEVALVTFDSQPEEEWSFTPYSADLADGFSHSEAGDHGAAVFDAIDHGIDMLRQQPANTRRILVLLSQPQDVGSHAHVEDIVHRLGENNITIYSVTFSPEKTWLKDQFNPTKPHPAEPYYKVTVHLPPVLNTFNLSRPLGMAMRAMQTNAASEVASLSGGESMQFSDKQSLEQQFTIVANHIPNRYMLNFYPSSKQEGFHSIQVQIPSHPDLGVSARTGYWSADKTETKPAALP
jgi:VWFA-related protein